MTEQSPQPDSALDHARQQGYESRDAATRMAWFAGGGLLLLVVGSMLAMALLLPWLMPPGSESENQALTTLREGSEIRLREFRLNQQQAQRAELHRYQWIDRPAGVAQIPIQRAIELIAADPALLEAAESKAKTEESSLEGDRNE